MEILFDLQKDHSRILKNSTAAERIKKLKFLEALILKKRGLLKEALQKDLHKSGIESDLTEIFPALNEIRFIRRNLRQWMQDKKVITPLPLFGTSSYVKYEAKGNILILSPWNYPINLCLVPLAGAIAAGNAVILKPSELAPNCSAVLSEMFRNNFDNKEIAVVEGGVETAQALLKLKFDHIFFTGSSRVGKLIMHAAADNLSEITLELGGKSPTIVDEHVNLKVAAKRIVWSKFINAGQTCIAPDYILVHKSKAKELRSLIKSEIIRSFGLDPQNSDSLGRIVNKVNYDRLENAQKESVSLGARYEAVGVNDPTDKFIAPAIVFDQKEEDYFSQEEIFGPVLSLVEYADMDEAIAKIQGRSKPLVLYIYSKNRKNINRIINETSSGAVVVNHGLLHFSNNYLPFGGVNESGIGRYHGKHTFLTFSNEKSILKQWFPLSVSTIISAPFTKTAKRIVDFIVRWL
jgi:aldehyde dehydrogenase (NAD+)